MTKKYGTQCGTPRLRNRSTFHRVTIFWPANPLPFWQEVRALMDETAEMHGDCQPDAATLDKMAIFDPRQMDADKAARMALRLADGHPVALVNHDD